MAMNDKALTVSTYEVLTGHFCMRDSKFLSNGFPIELGGSGKKRYLLCVGMVDVGVTCPGRVRRVKGARCEIFCREERHEVRQYKVLELC